MHLILGKASNFVEGVDTAFFVILGAGVFFLVTLTTIMLIFVFKYHYKRNTKPVQIHGNNLAEIIWTVIPLIIVLVMFWYGYTGFRSMREVPKDAMVIKTLAYMWDWEFTYDSGKKSRELFVPVNKPVKLEMKSKDVIHSLYIPAFRVKEDIVPGYDNYMWFIANEIGSYDILCAEYCGLQHSYMTSHINVLSDSAFQVWVKDLSDQPQQMEMKGLELLKMNACTGCHSLDGKEVVAPSFMNLFYRTRIVRDSDGNEKEITVDDEYMKRSVYQPDIEVVKGFNEGIMQSYEGVISEDELKDITEYLKSLKKE